MPNIWKAFSRPKVERYEFPEADELTFEEFTPPRVSSSAKTEEDPKTEKPETLEADEASAPQEPETEPEPEEEPDPIQFAQIQAEQILADARQQADALLEQAAQEAKAKAEEIYESSRQAGLEAGHAEGVVQGVAQALEENRHVQEQQVALEAAEIQKFLEKAGEALDRQLDDNVMELRDLAMAIAEKVVCVSLKSSSDVICRMIQTAVDKRKRREWAHVYIAGCDAKHLVKVPAPLTAALAALSDRVRIIPIADDESGTCIIEMPDEIIDASAATQMENIRTLLSDANPMESGGAFSGLNLGG